MKPPKTRPASGRRWAYHWHRWLGLCSSLFLLLIALTALALNHSDLWQPYFLKPLDSSQFSVAQAELLVANPHQPQRLLAADHKALYQSQDGGQHWQELKLYLPAEKVVGISFHPQQPQKLWVALQQVGVFYSEDQGEIWEPLELPFDPVTGEQILAMTVGPGPSLYLQTALGWYQQDVRGKWHSTRLAATDAQQAFDLHDWIWRLHTGKFWGSWGLWLYDAVAISLILLALTGLRLTLRRRPRRQLGKPQPMPLENTP